MQPFLTSCALAAGALALAPSAPTAVLSAPDGALPIDVAQGAREAPAALFPNPERGMLVRGGEGQVSLREVLRDFGSIAGETFLYDAETAQLLEAQKPGLDHDIQVAPEDMYSVLQSLLSEMRFALIDVRRQEPRLLKVVAVESRAGQRLRSSARFVPESALASYARNSALLVTTSVVLPNLEEIPLSSNLRSLIVDSNLERIVPVHGSRQLVLTGPAAQVGQWVEMLRELDRNAVVPESSGD
jgi:hypothetical protein